MSQTGDCSSRAVGFLIPVPAHEQAPRQTVHQFPDQTATRGVSR